MFFIGKVILYREGMTQMEVFVRLRFIEADVVKEKVIV